MTVRLHLLRLWRARRPHLAVLFTVFYLGLMLLGYYTWVMVETGGQAKFGFSLDNPSPFNGLTFVLYAVHFGVLLVLPIFAAIEGGAQVAEETASGTIFLFLTRPLVRWRLFLVKLTVATGYGAVLTAVLFALALGLSLVAVGWGDLDLRSGVLHLTVEPQHLGQGEALLRFLLACPAAALAALAPLTMSFLVAAWTRSSLNAVGISISLYLVMYAIGEVHFFHDLRPWLFPSHMTYWEALLQESIPWRRVAGDAAKLLSFSVLFALLAYRRFHLREER